MPRAIFSYLGLNALQGRQKVKPTSRHTSRPLCFSSVSARSKSSSLISCSTPPAAYSLVVAYHSTNSSYESATRCRVSVSSSKTTASASAAVSLTPSRAAAA